VTRFALATCLALAACDLSAYSVRLTAPVIARGAAAMERESDLEIARAAAAGQLKTVEGMLETLPRERTLLALAARASLEYGFGFLEDDLEATPDDRAHADDRQALVARATALYDRALDYAVRFADAGGLGLRDALARGDAALDAALARARAGDAIGLTYAGMAIAETVNLNQSDLSRVADLPKAIALLARARALDPRGYHGGASMALGLIHGSQPPARGGRLDEARRYFDEAIAVDHGRYLLARVMMARAYAVAAHDRALFDSTLRAVLDTDPASIPELRLANTLARRRAARYLALAHALF
jgi:tetratricopeptide (TPR) repeat protein